MRVAHYLVREPSGLFYFRLRVPLDLRATLGLHIVKRATGTRCPRQALAIATAWAARYAQAFDALRGQGMADKKLDDLLRSLGEAGPHGIRKYEVDLSRGYFKADGPADHSRMLESISAIGQFPPELLAAVRAQPAPQAPQTPACKPLDMAQAIRKWALTLPTDTPGKQKDTKSRTSKAEGFAAWKRGQVGRAFDVGEISRTDFAEYFIACKASTTKRGKAPAPRYIENQFLVLAGFMDWAMASGYYPQGDNPARGHAQVSKKARNRRAKTHGFQAFTADQLGEIFNPKAYASMTTDAARWLPLMALYTGARANELAHLELADCHNYAGTAVPVFDFNFLGDHKSLKTDASERMTPVHPDLIALGLWERVEQLRAAGETKLFPGLEFLAQNGPGNAAQRAFSRYLERLGIEARGQGKVGMHSFRDTAINTMKLAGVPRELREEYCGHELSQRGDHDEAYGVDLTPPALAEKCHPALDFGLDLPALRALLR